MSWIPTTGLVFSLAAFAFAGCAAKQAAGPVEVTPTSPERAVDEARGLARQMERHEEELAGLQAAASPNCPRAQALAGTICQIGERICQIAARHPDQAELKQRCLAAKASCERSRVKVAVRCPMGF